MTGSAPLGPEAHGTTAAAPGCRTSSSSPVEASGTRTVATAIGLPREPARSAVEGRGRARASRERRHRPLREARPDEVAAADLRFAHRVARAAPPCHQDYGRVAALVQGGRVVEP